SAHSRKPFSPSLLVSIKSLSTEIVSFVSILLSWAIELTAVHGRCLPSKSTAPHERRFSRSAGRRSYPARSRLAHGRWRAPALAPNGPRPPPSGAGPGPG